MRQNFFRYWLRVDSSSLPFIFADLMSASEIAAWLPGTHVYGKQALNNALNDSKILAIQAGYRMGRIVGEVGI